MAVSIPLSKPLPAHGGERTILELRDVDAGDAVAMRVAPFTVTNVGKGAGDEVRFEVRYDIAMGYLVRLSGLDEITLGALSLKDFNRACNSLVGIWNEVGE